MPVKKRVVAYNANEKSKKPKKHNDLSLQDFAPTCSCSSLYVCGGNEFGQIGLGEDIDSISKFTHVQLKDDVRLKMVAAGGVHSMLLTEDGDVYTVGANDQCALGRQCFNEDGSERDDETDYTFRKVPFREEDKRHGKIMMISAGDSHAAVLTDKGSVFIWGLFRGREGVIGLLYDNTRKTLVESALRPRLLVNHNEMVVVKIVSGSDHLAMLTSKGEILTCGANSVGQLGRIGVDRKTETSSRTIQKWLKLQKVPQKRIGTALKRYVDVYALTYGTFAIEEDGQVSCWGLNNYCQMGVTIKNDDMVCSLPMVSQKLSDKKLIAFSGDQHTLGLTKSGKVYGLGRGLDCRLGIGRSNDVEETPISVPNIDKAKIVGCNGAGACSFAWSKDGIAYAWGTNASGLLGLKIEEEEQVEKPEKVPLPVGLKVYQISTNGVFSLLLADSARN